MKWEGYSQKLWGITACDGPGDFRLPYKGETRQFFGYSARGPLIEPEGRDDGTLSPTAALGSLPFAPEIVLPCAETMLKWPKLFDHYGFKDSFNPSFTYTNVKQDTGSVDAKNGWVAKDYLGIDQGPILLQAANYRDDFVWRYMDIAVAYSSPVVELNAELERALRLPDEFGLIDSQQAIELRKRWDGRFADPDDTDLLGFNQDDIDGTAK